MFCKSPVTLQVIGTSFGRLKLPRIFIIADSKMIFCHIWWYSVKVFLKTHKGRRWLRRITNMIPSETSASGLETQKSTLSGCGATSVNMRASFTPLHCDNLLDTTLGKNSRDQVIYAEKSITDFQMHNCLKPGCEADLIPLSSWWKIRSIPPNHMPETVQLHSKSWSNHCRFLHFPELSLNPGKSCMPCHIFRHAGEQGSHSNQVCRWGGWWQTVTDERGCHCMRSELIHSDEMVYTLEKS